MMHLKGALHVHTTCSDGELSLEEAIQVHAELGYDFLALTDHDYLLRPDCYDPLPLIKSDLIVFTGREMTVFERGYCHVNRIEGGLEVLHMFNHPAQLSLPLAKAIERIKTVAQRLPLDAVEITNYGFRTREFETPLLPFPKVATDDSHNRAMCGRAWIEMDCRRDKDAILRAIKRGDFWNCYEG
ncbi:MAG: PHP domain-containing protein [Thermodesulfobacteriota bacterium]